MITTKQRPVRKSVSQHSLVLMGISKPLAKFTIEDFGTEHNPELEEVKNFVSDYITNLHDNFNSGVGLLFRGSNGTGKSMLSCIILKEAYRLRYSCRRVAFANYISAYTESWNVKNKSEQDEISQTFHDKYKGVEFLVLEEIGKEIDSKIAKPILEDLLRYREEHGLVTIICTNMTVRSIEESYGKSVMSLIKGCTVPLVLVSNDMRVGR